MSRFVSCALPLSAILFLVLGFSPAHAQLVLTLDHPNQIGVAGETLTFDAKVTSQAVRVDATSYDITNQMGMTFSSDNITDVFGPAHQGGKAFVDFGTTHQTLFKVTIPTEAQGGDYAMGHYYVSFTPTSDVAGVAFSVLVASAVPEPGSVALLVGIGISGSMFVRRRKNARQAA